MFRWCTVFVGMSLAFAVPMEYTVSSLSQEKSNYDAIANLDDLIQKIQRETLREMDAEEEIFPKTHDVMSLPNEFYVNEFIDYTRPIYDGIEGTSSIDYVNPEDNLPIEQCMQTKQENIEMLDEDQNPTKNLIDINNNYDDNDNIVPNIEEPLDIWPHTLPVYVPERIPSLENFGSYDIDVLNPANTEILLSNTRPNREGNNDFMAKLRYEAMMNNIIPTMSYVRDADEFTKFPISQAAVYPSGVLNNCGLPILVGCYPNVYNGILGSFQPFQPHHISTQPITPVTMASPHRGDIEFLDDGGLTDEDLNVHAHTPHCPPGELMGANLQCSPLVNTTNVTESHWEYYD